MPDANDMELLRAYARRGSETAFAELVQRHIALVYSVALRHVEIAAQAEEVTQAVFIILARKAGGLRPDTILEGWLYETTRLTSLSFLRGERRRQFREQEAYMQSTLQDSADDAIWTQLAPLLDDAMSRLGKKDRDAVVLRFFKNKSIRDVAMALNVTEAAAQRRVLRALEKLRKIFVKHGVSSTTAIIGGVISANSIQTAPVGLAKAISAVAVGKSVAASASTLTLIKGALKIMAWTKTKTAIVVGVIALLAAGTTTLTVKEVRRHYHPSWQVENPDPELMDNTPPQVKIVPTIFSSPVGGINIGNDKIVGIRESLNGLLGAAYQIDRYHITFETEPPDGNYDFIANLRESVDANRMALRQLIEKQFHLVGKKEIRQADVLVMTVKNRNAPGLQQNTSGLPNIRNQHGVGYWRGSNLTSANIADQIEKYFKKPVVDRADLTGRFDVDFKWNEQEEGQNADAFTEALLDQLGLELTPGREPVEMLVVQKTR
jgi:uncharacterized protein (TIGR03435 family)